MIRFIGEPFIRWSETHQPVWATRIATAFPRAGVIVTAPGIHATQRFLYTNEIEQERALQGLGPLSDPERMSIWLEAVDLLVEGDAILIRPDPSAMGLAFAADEMLQELVSRKRIKFLFARDARVREAINRRGEAWRIQPLPRSLEEMRKLIQTSRVAVGGEPIYYYCPVRGTRILTCAQFAGLALMSDEALRLHMEEIATLAASRNNRGWPELALFMTDDLGAGELVGPGPGAMDAIALRQAHAEACQRFAAATPAQFQQDDLDSGVWRNGMYRTLIAQDDDTTADEDLLGLGDEYFMQIQWLPGARVEDEELIFDTASDDGDSEAIAHALICNLMREYDGIEFVNMGHIIRSLSRRVPPGGRREVYIAYFRPRGARRDELHVIRFHKWGVRERLDEGKPMLQAMRESEEYTDYILDRRLACRQLGMKLAARAWGRKIQERYKGSQRGLIGQVIWTPYVEREYIPGIASDKAPRAKLKNATYAQQLAMALGRAAAPNLIVGRANPTGKVIFDDGDELLTEDAPGRMGDVVVADPTGSFTNFEKELDHDAPAYAAPIRDRLPFLTDGDAFTQAYTNALIDRFEHIQKSYRRSRAAFDALFSHRWRDPAGNLAHRWAKVLARLDRSDPKTLARIILANV